MSEYADDLKWWLALSRTNQIGSVRAARLEAYFGSMEEAWKANANDLRASGLDPRAVTGIVEGRQTVDPDAEVENLRQAGVKAYTWTDPKYPARLKQVDDKPPVLYVRGELLPEDEWAIAVVGTRRASAYGRQAAEDFATDLARSRITVVSGLARGIDSVAHRATLTAGGRTIAVLACGLDLVYPAENAKLAREIMEHGALVSDYPLGTQPLREYFPRRNRILSALSLGVLVVEGGENSGSLITARIAIDQNREVFAVPGSIYSDGHKGPNKLIREGEARLVSTASDILEELNLTVTTHQPELVPAEAVDQTEAALLKVITNEPIHIDDVLRSSGLPIAEVSGKLAVLEMKGIVRQVGAMSYIRVRDVSVTYSTS